MKTDNELIAEFMKNDAINSPHLLSAKELETYYQSWNTLHQVIDKINKLWDESTIGNPIQFVADEEPTIDFHYMEVIALPVSSSIEAVYKAVVEFIKWYNNAKR